jgi:hypothetical protein
LGAGDPAFDKYPALVVQPLGAAESAVRGLVKSIFQSSRILHHDICLHLTTDTDILRVS